MEKRQLGLTLIPLVIRGILIPVWIGIPRIGGVWSWKIHFALAIVFPVVSFFLLNKAWRLEREKINQGIRVFLLIFLFSVSFYAIRLYVMWSSSEVGRYFLPPTSKYYQGVVADFAEPYLFYAATGMAAGFSFWLLYIFTAGRAIEKNAIYLAVLLGLIHGPLYIVYVVAGAFGIGVIQFLIKPSPYLRITPFLFVSSYIILLTRGWLL